MNCSFKKLYVKGQITSDLKLSGKNRTLTFWVLY